MNPQATFTGKSAIVTHAAYGIGRHLALALARDGARLLLTDTHPEGLRELCDQIRQSGGEAYAMCLSDPSDSERVLQQAHELFGTLDFACFTGGDGRMRIAPVLASVERQGEPARFDR
jgi:NAD(P)-dependent dehydrogenase (short-subunit alcohol dehydrogenase family)